MSTRRRDAAAREGKRTPRYGGEFPSELFTYPGKGGWTFATVPKRVRGTKGHGDTVRVRIEFDAL